MDFRRLALYEALLVPDDQVPPAHFVFKTIDAPLQGLHDEHPLPWRERDGMPPFHLLPPSLSGPG